MVSNPVGSRMPVFETIKVPSLIRGQITAPNLICSRYFTLQINEKIRTFARSSNQPQQRCVFSQMRRILKPGKTYMYMPLIPLWSELRLWSTLVECKCCGCKHLSPSPQPDDSHSLSSSPPSDVPSIARASLLLRNPIRFQAPAVRSLLLWPRFTLF